MNEDTCNPNLKRKRLSQPGPGFPALCVVVFFSVICNYVSSIKFDGGHKKNKKKKEILNSFDGERQFPFPQYQRNEHEIIYIIIY
jgi:hypothetical protein